MKKTFYTDRELSDEIIVPHPNIVKSFIDNGYHRQVLNGTSGFDQAITTFCQIEISMYFDEFSTSELDDLYNIFRLLCPEEAGVMN